MQHAIMLHHVVEAFLAADERDLARVLGADKLARLQSKVVAVMREAADNEPLQRPRKKMLRNRLQLETGASPYANGERRMSFDVILHKPIMQNVMSLLLHPRVLVQTGLVCRAFSAVTQCAELDSVEISVKQLEQCVLFSGPDWSPAAKLYSLLSQPLCKKLKTLSLILNSDQRMDGYKGLSQCPPKSERTHGSERCFDTVSCFKVLASRRHRFHAQVASTLFSSMASLRAVHLQNVTNISGALLKHLSKACPSLIELWLVSCTYENYSEPSWPLTELSGLGLRSLCLDDINIFGAPSWWATWRRGQPAWGNPQYDVGLAFTAVSATIEFLSLRGLFRGKFAVECVTTVVERAQHLKCLRCTLSADLHQICKSLRPLLAIHEDAQDWNSLV